MKIPEYKKVSKFISNCYEFAESLNGGKFWHLNGKLHRKNGPAIEHRDGTKEWWLNGLQIF
jgi:hypothetical protein